MMKFLSDYERMVFAYWWNQRENQMVVALFIYMLIGAVLGFIIGGLWLWLE